MKKEKTHQISCIKILPLVFLVAYPDSVCAQEEVRGLVALLPRDEIGSFIYLLAMICCVCGFYMLVAGIVGYNKRESNPVTEPVRKNIMRIVVGGLVIAVPVLMGALQQSVVIPRAADSSLQLFAGLTFATAPHLLP